jgi:predicted O-methyltransferase YrrM
MKPIIPIKRRGDLGSLVQAEGFTSAIEIGVQKGEYAAVVLSQWPANTEYWCVDLWQVQKNYHDMANAVNHDAYFAETQSRLAPYGSRVKYIRDYSTKAALTFKNESIDFIYVDARHDYAGVMEDMVAYWPILKTGGILAGHDYMNVDEVKAITPSQDWAVQSDGTRRTDNKAVRSAVDEFALSVGRSFAVTYREGSWETWYMRK